MTRQFRIGLIQYVAVAIVWVVVYISPFMFNGVVEHDWRSITTIWVECSIVLLVFLVNRFVLMPYLFFKQKYLKYLAAVVLLLVAIFIFGHYADGINRILHLFGYTTPRPMRMPMRMPRPPSLLSSAPHLSVIIMSFFVILFDIGLNISIKWLQSERKQAILNSENVSAQLAMLQSQVSPHFFMNTLNNIHALVMINQEKAQETIIELSHLMNYLLYEANTVDNASLKGEIKFIENYVNLMRIRYSEDINIEVTYDSEVPNIKVPPLLFLNFIENAFKYGISYSDVSYIKMSFTFQKDYLIFDIVNTNYARKLQVKNHGLGIDNNRKRLELLYNDSYTLNIDDSNNLFHVNLKIPISS